MRPGKFSCLHRTQHLASIRVQRTQRVQEAQRTATIEAGRRGSPVNNTCPAPPFFRGEPPLPTYLALVPIRSLGRRAGYLLNPRPLSCEGKRGPSCSSQRPLTPCCSIRPPRPNRCQGRRRSGSTADRWAERDLSHPSLLCLCFPSLSQS